MEPIRIFLIDQHEVVRTQLGLRIDREPDFRVVGQSTLCEQALADIRLTDPDILLIDPVHRNGTCLDSIQEITRELPNLFVVVLTAIPDTSLQLNLRKVGVHKILPKGIETELLLEELKKLVLLSVREK